MCLKHCKCCYIIILVINMKSKKENYFENILEKNYEIYHYCHDVLPLCDFHNHEFYEIYFFIDGTVAYCIEEMTFDLMTGDVLIIPPSKMHMPIVSEGVNYERIVLWLRRSFIESLDDENHTFSNGLKELRDKGNLLMKLKGKDYSKIINLLSDIEKEISLHEENESLVVASYITILLANLLRISKLQVKEEKTVVNQSIVPSIIEYINLHLTEKLTSENIAEKFFISKYHLHHIFKEYTNVSLYDYILSKRIIYAKSLIRHGHNFTDACFTCGFKDYSSFYKAFLTKTGMSPREFKKSIKKTM